MDTIKIMLVDDEPLIRKALKMELNSIGSVACGISDDGEVRQRRVEVLNTYGGGAQLMAALDSPLPHDMPDYLLLDMEFQGEPTGGLSITRRVHAKYPNIKILILSGRFDNPPSYEEGRQDHMLEIARVVFEALHLGACAFVSKNAAGGFSVENVLRAIECLERGEHYYFNYPVMLTLKEMAEQYVERANFMRCDVEVSETERQLLLLEAAGCTASEIAASLRETDKVVQERQKELSRKLGTVNKSGARIAKAIQYGIVDLREVKFLKR